MVVVACVALRAGRAASGPSAKGRALLSRVGTKLALGGLASLLATAFGTAVGAWLGASVRDVLATAIPTGVTTALLVTISSRLSDITLFHARAEYKPTIDRLSEELVTLSSPQDVALAIERTIQH